MKYMMGEPKRTQSPISLQPRLINRTLVGSTEGGTLTQNEMLQRL